MRIFYDLGGGTIVSSTRLSFSDVSGLFKRLLPEKIVLEDTKQVVIRERFFGSNLLETFYALKGYEVYNF